MHHHEHFDLELARDLTALATRRGTAPSLWISCQAHMDLRPRRHPIHPPKETEPHGS